MVPAVVAGVVVLLAALGYLLERHGDRHGAGTTKAVPLEEHRPTRATSYLRESIATSLVHEPHHPGYCGRRR